MSRLVAVEYLSLDGVFESPGWSGPYFDEEVQKFQYDNLFGSDALVLGRLTYEAFAAAWPGMATDEQGFGERMNSLPKHVVTSSTATPEWNASFITGDVDAQITELKNSDGGDLLINGSGDLVTYLTSKGLIDEYRFMIFPIILGQGRRLFPEGVGELPLRLTKSQVTPSGVAILTYEPA
ncbi:dihydrofolate reductase family protein [soil metagenome]